MPDNQQRITELQAELDQNRAELPHAATPTHRRAIQRAIGLIEAELEQLTPPTSPFGAPAGVCPLCGYYITPSAAYTGRRCIVRSHWAAAGLEVHFKEQPLAAAITTLAAALLKK